MQLDFTQFLTKFEKISSMKPVPHREYVENYVKAYYLPEAELEQWIREHPVSGINFFFSSRRIPNFKIVNPIGII